MRFLHQVEKSWEEIIEEAERKAREVLGGEVAPSPPSPPTPTETKPEVKPAEVKVEERVEFAPPKELADLLKKMCSVFGGHYLDAPRPLCLIPNIVGVVVDSKNSRFGVMKVGTVSEVARGGRVIRRREVETTEFIIPPRVDVTVVPQASPKVRLPSLTFEIGKFESELKFTMRGIRDIKQLPEMACTIVERPRREIRCFIIPSKKVGRREYEDVKPEDFTFDPKRRKWKLFGKELRKFG